MGLSVKNTNYVIIVLTCDLGMFLFLKNVKNWNFLNWYLYVFKQKEHFSPNPLLVGNQGGKKVRLLWYLIRKLPLKNDLGKYSSASFKFQQPCKLFYSWHVVFAKSFDLIISMYVLFSLILYIWVSKLHF